MVIGIVDVLKLTYATLEQINQMNTPEGEGPMWNRFWNTLDNDTESVHSGDGHSAIHSHRPETPMSPPPMHQRIESGEAPHLNPLISDSLLPNDSASITAVHDTLDDAASQSPLLAAVTKDESFVFKFKSPAGRVHRLRFDVSLGLQDFRNVMGDKLTGEEKSLIGGPIAEETGFGVSFIDDEGDIVSILSIDDLSESITIAKRQGKDKVDLYIHHPNSPPSIESPSTVSASKEVVPEAAEKGLDIADQMDATPKETIGGVPNELLLPGAIVVLAAVIVGVFLATRVGGKR